MGPGPRFSACFVCTQLVEISFQSQKNTFSKTYLLNDSLFQKQAVQQVVQFLYHVPCIRNNLGFLPEPSEMPCGTNPCDRTFEF